MNSKIFIAPMLAFLFLFSAFLPAQQILFDNGPFVTDPGGGPGGSDYSFLEIPLVSYGFSNKYSVNYRVSDDFTVTGDGWVIDSIVFFQYQTGSTTASTITGTNVEIWQGSSLVWGDPSTNRLQRSVWTGCYRGNDFTNTQRPIMRNTCVTPSLSLPAGNYFLDWQSDGSLASGPWCVPITIIGQYTTGDAQKYSDGNWSNLYDDDSLHVYQQGLPFIIYGRAAGYPATITINQTYTFSDPYSLSSYRIIGLPGQTNFSLASVISGKPGENWTAFWDNGHSEDYMKSYDGSANFTFSPGKAFWVTSTSQVAINKTVNSVSLNSWDGYEISINTNGWTLISNPFEKDVSLNAIKVFNGLPDNATLWDWNSSWNSATTLQTGKGYYYFDAIGSSSVLDIPYPGKKETSGKPITEPGTGGLTLSLMEGDKTISGVHIIYNDQSSSDFDKNDIIIPPGDFETAGIRILAPQVTGKYKEFFVESRKAVEEGQSYQIQLKNSGGRKLQLACKGLENFPDQEIYLVSNTINHSIDLKKEPIFDIPSGAETRTLLIGNLNYIEQQTTQLFARDETLFNCYPNPFSSFATIGFSTKTDGFVNIEVYDVAGRKIRQIVDRQTPKGYHEISFNAEDLDPGIYFCRMYAFSLTSQTTFNKVIRLEIY